MERSLWLAAVAVVTGALLGCSQATTPEETASSAPTASKPLDPAEAVFEFLEAVRLGSDERASAMLTKLARQKTEELDMVVAPPGSDTASFEVGPVNMVDGQGAHVESAWTDLDHEGNKRTDHITWILRKEKNDWKIAGMATQIFADQEAVVLNFEDPEDMLQKQRDAEEEAMRRTGQHRSAQSEDPFQAETKRQ